MTRLSPEKVKLPRASKGKRPHFFDDPSIDQVMTFVLELMAEVSVLRDRLDTVERLLARKGVVRREDIEEFQAKDSEEAERAAWRQEFIKRVLRMHAPG
jgi:hypothetical protein